MIIFPFLIICLFFLSSCMSELKEPEPGPIPEVCCMQSEIEDIQTADSLNGFSRGWEGGVGPYDQFPSVIYPLDQIYLMVEDPSSPDGWKSMPIPVQKKRKKRFVEICYKADENDNYNIYAKSGDNSIMIGPNKKCFFSSIPNIKTGLEQSPNITTPGGQEVYEPYGDKLFRSDYYSFTFDKSKNKIYSLNQGRFTPVDQFSQIPMFRGTSIIIPRLVISDEYPKWEDGLPVPNGDSDLTLDTFLVRLGPLENWKVRFFISGMEGDHTYDFPLDINLDSFSQLGQQVEVGKIDSNRKGIVALSENILNVRRIDHTLMDNNGNRYTYAGFGVHDASYPFLYGVKGFDMMDMCCSIYYNDPVNNISKNITLRFPMDETELYINNIFTVTYVIDVDDVAREFNLAKLYSRSIGQWYDKSFGKIANIPAIIIKDRSKKHPSIR